MSRKTGKPSYTRPVQRSVPVPWRAIIGLAVAVAIGLFLGMQFAGPGAAESAVAQMRKEEARRDLTQIAELTARARETLTVVKPLIDGMAASAPAAGEAQVAQWKQAVAKEVAWYSETVSGTTATNVARGGLRTAVEQLAAAVDLYAAAGATAEPARTTLTQMAVRQRDLAIKGWSVAATQLDQLNVDAGLGHQHVYLNTTGVGGAMTGDHLPEGTKP